MNHDAMFFARLLAERDPKGLRLVRRDDFDEAWQMVYDFIVEHAQAHGALPHVETVEMSCRTMLGTAPESLDFYARRIRDNAMRRTMEEGFVERVVTPLSNEDPAAALAGAADVVAKVRREFRDETTTLLDYNTNTDIRWRDYEIRERAGDVLGLPCYWDSLTRMTGGYLPGEAWVIAARPNIGKSFVVDLEAVTLYQRGCRVLLCSMETPAQDRLPRSERHRIVGGHCIRCRLAGVSGDDPCPAAEINRQRLSIRLDSLGAGVSAWRYLKGTLTPRERERMQVYLDVVKAPEKHGYGWGSLRVVSPPDVRSLAELELEVLSYAPDVVIWDSAYLGAETRAAKKRKDAYDDLLIGFKAMLDTQGIPGILTWHFNRDVTEKAVFAGLGETAYTDELGRLTDVVVGLFRTPDHMRAREAILRTLKVRDGLRLPELKMEWDVKDTITFREISAEEHERKEEPKPKGRGRKD